MIFEILKFIKLCITISIILLLRYCNIEFEYMYKILYNDILLNGCFTIKFTQWIVCKINNLFEQKYIPKYMYIFNNTLENCPIHSYKLTQWLFQNSLKCDIEDICYDINKCPIASGSIGQVYKAKLRYNDKVVAIKVQHPNLKRDIFIPQLFLSIILWILKISNIIQYYLPIDFDDFFKGLQKQLDFNIEANNLQTYYKNYKDNNMVIIPELYIFTEDILIMSYEDGVSFNSISDKKIKYIAANLMILTMRQGFLIDNFINIDLHEGNWKIRLDNNEIKLIIYDMGLCFSNISLEITRNFIIAWGQKNVKNICNETLNMLYIKEKDNISKHNISKLTLYIEDELKQFNTLNTCMSSLLIKIFNIIKKFNLTLSGKYLNLMLTLIIMEDLFRKNGILSESSNLDNNNFSSSEYIDNITFCKTYNVFHKISDYMEYIVDNNMKTSMNNNKILQQKNLII